MYGKLISALYVMNIVFQAFVTLLIPAGLGWLGAWLLVTYASCPPWVYAPLIVIGVLVGFYSMIKFVLTAMSGYERLEKEFKSSRSERGQSGRASATRKISVTDEPVAGTEKTNGNEEASDEEK